MQSTSTSPDYLAVPGLVHMGDKFYNPSEDDEVVLKSLAGIKNEDELKQPTISIQREAFEVLHMAYALQKSSIQPNCMPIMHKRSRCIDHLEDKLCPRWPASRKLRGDRPACSILGIRTQALPTTPETFLLSFIQGSIVDPAIITGHWFLSTGSHLPTLWPSDLRSLTPD
ncbi:hypothetical protein K488DRAFT_68605 [Vararia minispora EC-137]|uniref:Uncharacterized protein n=1 Tax=Vararia minispora EC-137 TaxID=1314806 RepID=A0ACB8QU81_9AGAM|nr:hypothetical protein K488DRAFT_68605 [Vararia minispora EC-137]